MALSLLVSHVALDAFERFTRGTFPSISRDRRNVASVMFVLFAWCAIAWPLSRSWPYRANLILASQGTTADVIRQLGSLHVVPKANSKVLFVNDPFDGFDMLFIAELIWNDPTLDIQLSQKMPALSSRNSNAFDEIFTFEGSVLILEKHSR